MQENKAQIEYSETDQTFETEIKAITEELEKYGTDHCGERDLDLREYSRKCEYLGVRLKQSILLINTFGDTTSTPRKDNILKIARKSSVMIKENNDDFYQLQDDWDHIINAMKSNNEVLNTLLSSKEQDKSSDIELQPPFGDRKISNIQKE